MTENLEERLKTVYNMPPKAAEKVYHIHEKLKDKPYWVKMTGIVLSPFAPCFPKTQEAIYEILGMGPKEEAYKVTMWNTLDMKGQLFLLAACLTGTSLQSLGMLDYFPTTMVETINNNLAFAAYSVAAEGILVGAASYLTKKPLPRPLTLVFSVNPIMWLDTMRVTRNTIKKGYQALGRITEAMKKEIAFRKYEP